ncbi:partial oligoendopeptidase F, partial [Planctomycetaceae bacterium]
MSDAPLATERDRSRIPAAYTWDLSPVYPSLDAWRTAKDAFVARLPAIDGFRGTLGSSAQRLRACLDLTSDIGKEFSRLYTFVSAQADIDTRDSNFLALQQEIGQIGTDLGTRTAFIEPEILTIDRTVIDRFFTEEPGLAIHRMAIDDVLRRKEHTGTEAEERIIAEAGLMAETPGAIYTVFSNADFPFAEVTLSDGKTVKLDRAAFPLFRTLPDREDRRKVFEGYFGRMHDYRRTIGTQLYSEVKKNLFYQRARKYPSCLHAALHGNNIPVEVYHALIANVHGAFPVFHRYLDLRRRLLGVDKLHYHDLYAHVVPGVTLAYTFWEARDVILA